MCSSDLICGLVVDTLLVVNNYRDRDADFRSGKRTIIVRFGEPFGRYLYLILGILAALLCLYYLPQKGISVAIVAIVYLILHILTWRKMVKIHSGKKLNSILGESSRNMLLLSILLSLAIAFA